MAIFKYNADVELVAENQNKSSNRTIETDIDTVTKDQNVVKHLLIGVHKRAIDFVRGPSNGIESVVELEDPEEWINKVTKDSHKIEESDKSMLTIYSDPRSLYDTPSYSIYKVNGSENLNPPTTVPIEKIKNGNFTSILSNVSTSLSDSNNSSYNSKILAETLARQLSANKLMSSLGNISAEFGGNTVKMYNFVGVDPATGVKIDPIDGKVDRTDYNLSFNGHKDLSGLSIGTGYLWDITLENYSYNELGTFAPPVPRVIKKHDNSLGPFIPAISYTYNRFSTKTESYTLYNDSNIDFISGIKSENTLEVSLVDDQDLTWKRYFISYMNSIYYKGENCVAPIKQSCLKCSIMSFNVSKKIFFLHRLLVIPIDITHKVEGEESANAADLTVSFSVVGDLDPLYL